MKRTLSETESRAVVNALHVAANVYRKDQAVVTAFGSDERAAKQFEHQVSEALGLAEELEGYLISVEM